jgi:hypothetical protein
MAAIFLPVVSNFQPVRRTRRNKPSAMSGPRCASMTRAVEGRHLVNTHTRTVPNRAPSRLFGSYQGFASGVPCILVRADSVLPAVVMFLTVIRLSPEAVTGREWDDLHLHYGACFGVGSAKAGDAYDSTGTGSLRGQYSSGRVTHALISLQVMPKAPAADTYSLRADDGRMKAHVISNNREMRPTICPKGARSTSCTLHITNG